MIDRSYLPYKSAREYKDRGMAKWMGFFISEHSTALSKEGDTVDFYESTDDEEKILYLTQAFLNRKKVNQLADQCIKDFEIACDNRDQPVRMLSGGNIQKVVVAREFTSGANFILANQPTRGIDVGAAQMIRKAIVQKSRTEGVATLLISADLNEILECTDRLLVMRKGKIVAAFPETSKVTEEELGEYMLGLKEMSMKEMEGVL